MNPRVNQTGFTMLELAIVMLLIGILASVYLNRMLRYQEFAEKTVMEATVANMRSGLRYRIAELMMTGRMNEMASLSRENPMSWLKVPPPNYLGHVPQQRRLPLGSWHFDPSRHELVYLPERNRYFKPGPDGQKAIRFRVSASSRMPAPTIGDRVEWISLAPVASYDWTVF